MTQLLPVLLINLLAGFLVWLLSVRLRNVAVVDSLWGLMFWFAAVYWFLSLPEFSLRALLILLMVSVWAWRLSIYLTWRNLGEEEDHRYQKIRANNDPGFWWKSLYIIFALQAILAWLASLVIYGAINSGSAFGWFDAVGVCVWLFGMFFETVGDWQLARFKSDEKNQGRVLQTGLWSFTRHPNYFGEFCVWWGIWLMAVGAGAAWTIVSPLLMTVLLLRVSGVTLLEDTIQTRRPEYREYILHTNAFFPWFVKRGKNDA